MSLYDEYCAIVGSLSKEPETEAQTRLWVLDRVLREVLGYKPEEILPEDTGAGGTKPDYTILSDHPHCWFLEAKAWAHHLVDDHAVQATRYGYDNGKQWVVLSNGREWRLYDSHVTSGGVAERLVLRATQEEPEAMETLLRALRRETVVAGRLEAELAQYLLVDLLRQELQRADSECMAALRNVVKKRPRLSQTTGSDIVAALAKAFAPPQVPPAPTAESSRDEAASEPPAVPPSDDEGVPLDSVGDVTNTKPRALILPDGTRQSITYWWNVWETVIRYAAAHGPKPVPVPWRPANASFYWVHAERSWAGGKLRMPVKVELEGRTFYIETSASASTFVSVSRKLCAEVGIDPSTIRIVYG